MLGWCVTRCVPQDPIRPRGDAGRLLCAPACARKYSLKSMWVTPPLPTKLAGPACVLPRTRRNLMHTAAPLALALA